ncbi:hypothetical protein B296_00033327 [Ensete ventricosum]|uniref:Uncharacterized protein n=1 Tax=Ensete ventricosum TaxID=4639 RepID=A0A426ZJM8_ENSVE|nr:hypothetical protein B296_00033327 [Ensete ventricosum]
MEVDNCILELQAVAAKGEGEGSGNNLGLDGFDKYCWWWQQQEMKVATAGYRCPASQSNWRSFAVEIYRVDTAREEDA